MIHSAISAYVKTDLPVYVELPAGYEESFSEAYLVRNNKGLVLPHVLHFCKKCGGWVPGRPIRRHIHEEMLALTGKQGVYHHCRRCGHEMCFIGKMS